MIKPLDRSAEDRTWVRRMRSLAERRAELALCALAATALGLLVFFDLGPPLAFNDDWMYAWSVGRLAAGHLVLYPDSSALALTQIAWSAVVTFGHNDPRLLRLSLLPFVALLGWSTFNVARRLGVGSFWSGVAGLVVTTSPLFIANATSFMTDIPYVALEMAAVWNFLRWQQDGRGKAWTVILVTAATAQRQLGALIAVALTVAICVNRPNMRRRRGDLAAIAALWIAAAAAVMIPQGLGLTPVAVAKRVANLGVDPASVAVDLCVLPAEIGLAVIPFAVGLLTIPYARPRRDHRGPALIGLAGAVSLILVTHSGIPISGDSFQPIGLMDFLMPNPQSKAQLYPWPLYEAVMAIAVASFAAFAIWRWGAWKAAGVQGVLLAAVALGQLAPWLVSPHFAFDRYYFPVAAPLVPLAACMADQSVRPRLAKVWSIAALACGLALYAVGEQDYQAWQQARDQTARVAYRTTSPQYVDAGYETNAVYWELPYYVSTGQDLSLSSDPSGWDFAILGPRQPQARLLFAPADDPRPGVTYRSLAGGKIVIEAVRKP